MKHCGKTIAIDKYFNSTCGKNDFKCPECIKADHDAMVKDMIRLKIAVRATITGELDMNHFVQQVHKITMHYAHGLYLDNV